MVRFTLRAMTSPSTSDHHTIENMAAFCKAAGDSLRLGILRVLSKNSFGVLELAHIFDMGQSGISHHLKVLTQAGWVATRREGNAVFYRRSLAPDSGLQQALLSQLDTLPLPSEVEARIIEVHHERASASQAFFQRSAQDFSRQQELIASLHQYQDSLTGLLDTQGFAANATALEIGPGDGSFLPELASRFAQVTAIDNSSTMLELARQLCQQQQLANVALQLGDALAQPLAPVDCIVLNMVLHHFAAPAAALEHIAHAIKPGGSLILNELCAHDQDWARQACGDLWLGFEQNELSQWARQAGLTPGDSIYLGLKNGFQIQLRQFGKPLTQAHNGDSIL